MVHTRERQRLAAHHDVGSENGNGNYEAFNAFAKPGDAKAGPPNDGGLGPHGYFFFT